MGYYYYGSPSRFYDPFGNEIAVNQRMEIQMSPGHWHIDQHCIYKGCFHLNGCGKKRKIETIN